MSKIVKGVNDLATTDPNIAKEWNYNKNMDITPFEVVRGSAKRVWWICDKGHEWQTVIYARTKGQTKCPYCCNQKILSGYNDLQTNNPKLVREWDYDKNGNLKPSEVSPNTRKKVWWKCNKGHEWKASISDRQRGDGCPYCSGHTVLPGYNDLNTNNPNLAKEWNYNKNGSLTPEKVTNNSGKKVWWICDKGHEWQATIASRNYGNGCPKCANENQTSFPEKIVFYYISNVYKDAIENYKPEWLKPMELDIYIPSIKTAIEYDGRQWHKDSRKDNVKNDLCVKQGIKLYRLREKGCSIINNNSINFTLENIKVDGSQVVEGIKWLSKQIGFNTDVNISRDFNEINEIINYYKKEKCLINSHLIHQWNYNKNGSLTPEKVTNNSGKKVWWICDKGHEWQAGINDRQRGDGCPYCSGHKVLKGFNDLFTTNPELKKQWDYNRNKNVDPTSLSKGSSKKVWWICNNGHSYQQIINSKSKGIGCPICDGKLIQSGCNDLKTKNPKLAIEWNYEKNKELTPDMVAPNSNKKVWWICDKGHEWQAVISSRNNNSNCPICGNKKLLKGYNDVATTNHQILLDWDYIKNDEIDPANCLATDKTMCWWKCHLCGFEYKKSIYNKVRSPRCPNCKSEK